MGGGTASPIGPADPQGSDPRARPRRERTRAGRLRRIGLSLLVLLILGFAASYLVDEPLRRSIERGMNASLRGYTVSVPRARFRPIGCSITLFDVTILQKAHPQPPVLQIPRLEASVQWRELLTGHLVADFLLDRPELHLNLPQLRTEIRDATPVKERGWQQALEAIYPLKINLLRIHDASIVYVDDDPGRPLRLSHFELHANNIRNIHSRDRTYPSPIRVETGIFDKGRGRFDGHADFLAEPSPGIQGRFDLEQVPLDLLKPVAARSYLRVSGGILSTSGETEYGPHVRAVRMKEVTVRGIRLDYVHAEATAGGETAQAEAVSAAVRKAGEAPDVDVQVESFHLIDGSLGFVNEARTPAYRAFVSAADVRADNLSNGLRKGAAAVHARGLFMGSGPTRIDATFRPESRGTNFDLAVAVGATDMTAMNDLLRAYGKFDVAAGSFSLYSELLVRESTVKGYVKPLFREMRVYDKGQDREKPFFRRLRERVVQGIANLLQNHARKEVATKVDLSGPIESPKSSSWQVIGRLIQNAFFRSILPGFDEALARPPERGS